MEERGRKDGGKMEERWIEEDCVSFVMSVSTSLDKLSILQMKHTHTHTHTHTSTHTHTYCMHTQMHTPLHSQTHTNTPTDGSKGKTL